MDVFPAFIPLAERRVVIVGEGEQADAKARLFDGSPAELVRISAEDAAFNPETYVGAALAFIAGEEAFCRPAAAAARAAAVPVNVVDRPALSDFQTPSIVDRGAVVGAIGTGGSAPLLGSRLRTALEVQWPQGLGRVAALFRTLQPEIRARLPDLDARRTVLRAILDGPAAAAAQDGDMETALSAARAALAGPVVWQGGLWRLDAPDDLELLTLKAVRVLGRADRIVASAAAPAELIALARRDALRHTPDQVSGEMLKTWVEAGQAVVRLVMTGEECIDVTDAARRGVEVAILPIACGRACSALDKEQFSV
jgi:precorrin-2 dehydrogenase/sirohydrochlorin ferrochelatase